MYKRVNELLGTDFKSNEEVIWDRISIFEKLSESFIREFRDYVSWNYISIHQTLSESFIREFEDKVDWGYIFYCQGLISEDFIREFRVYVDWSNILYNRFLSWNFILEFEEKLNWTNISYYQPFIDPNYEKIDKECLEKNKLYKLYQQTKNRGWFVGYVFEYPNSKCVMSTRFLDYCTKKVKVYWKNLSSSYLINCKDLVNFESIRQIKYV